ncbi:MAG: Holliday junction resolvase RecU [Lachnospiraceae bacterium]|nr:Holliday junction resolvase RecU [Lachnospiraceae bacterium]
MSSWNFKGLRGSMLEEMVNRTNEQYRKKGLALIQKVPTPIIPIKFNKEYRHITLAYFEQKSTVDYIGAVQGLPVCFDAKECKTDSFPLINVHQHQIQFMADFERQKGIAFLLLYFSGRGFFYYLRFFEFCQYVERAERGGRKRFKFQELDPEYELKQKHGIFLHYLEGVQKDLLERD